MRTPTSALGVDDVRAGWDYHPDYDKWKHTDALDLRVRTPMGPDWAAPRAPQGFDGKITLQALQLSRKHVEDIL